MPPIVKNKKKNILLDKVVVLTTNSEEKSARRLGYFTSTYWPHEKDSKKSVVLRVGNGFEDAPIDNPIFDDSDDFKYVINPQKAISLNVDKPRALQILSQVVPTPKIYLDKVPKGETVVFRPRNHANGENFKLLKGGGFDIPEGYYCTQFIQTEKEYRIFICGSKTITCSRKKTKKTDSNICRSGWAYTRFRRSPRLLHAIALKASKAIGLEISALDVLVKGKKYYVLEQNSSPSFEGGATAFYRKNIPILIKKKFPKLFKKK